MNPLERLQKELSDRFTNLDMDFIRPIDRETGIWDLTIRRGGSLRPIVVEWNGEVGFGISIPEEGDFGVGSDEYHSGFQEAFDRIVFLITSELVKHELPI